MALGVFQGLEEGGIGPFMRLVGGTESGLRCRGNLSANSSIKLSRVYRLTLVDFTFK